MKNGFQYEKTFVDMIIPMLNENKENKHLVGDKNFSLGKPSSIIFGCLRCGIVFNTITS
jgi:hypothetical protein